MEHLARVERLPSVSRETLAFALAALCCILYLAGLVFYRLCLSPLAAFPGPKLTAMTAWYESYCELIKGGGGQFVFQIKRWHDEYGAFGPFSPIPSLAVGCLMHTEQVLWSVSILMSFTLTIPNTGKSYIRRRQLLIR